MGRRPLPAQHRGLVQALAGNRAAIGYAGMSYLNPGIEGLAIDGVAPTMANLCRRVYPLTRELYLASRGEPEGLAARFVAFLLSEEGNRLVAREGYLPLAGCGNPEETPQ